MSSAQIISATAFHSKMALPGLPRPAYPAVSGVSESVSWRSWAEDTWVFERVLGPAEENPEDVRKNWPKGSLFRANLLYGFNSSGLILCSHWCKTIVSLNALFKVTQVRKQSDPLGFQLPEIFLGVWISFLVQDLVGLKPFGPSWPFLKLIIPKLILSA